MLNRNQLQEFFISGVTVIVADKYEIRLENGFGDELQIFSEAGSGYTAGESWLETDLTVSGKNTPQGGS